MSNSFFSQPQYAACYPNHLQLPQSRSVFEVREASSGIQELQSLYPRLVQSAGQLAATITELDSQDGFVAVTAATDPLTVSADDLAGVMAGLDHLARFKTHYLIDRRLGVKFSDHHRRDTDRALKFGAFAEESMEVVLGEWLSLYGNLVKRHVIAAPFSSEWFRQLSRTIGLKFYSHRHEGRLIAAAIWAIDGPRAYYMFSAAEPEGYRVGSHYGLVDIAVTKNPQVELFDLGGNPGPDDPQHGLSRFKSGFSNRRSDSYLIGKILNRPVYDRLLAGRRARYFPGYRSA